MLRRSFAATIFLLTLLVACGDTAPSAAVVNVTIPGGNRELTVGQSVLLSAEVTVTGGASTAVTWTSSSHGVASVSSTGRVEAKEAGTGTITARSAFDSTKSASIQVTVSEPAPRVVGVAIDQGDRTMVMGDTFTFTATVSAEGGASTGVLWGTSDAAVATVDTVTGTVTAEALGSATISATSTFDSAKSDFVTVTVAESLSDPSVLSVQIVEPNQTLGVGATFTFTAIVTVDGGAPTTVSWSSSNAGLASVDPTTGEVTAEAPGATTITATSTYDGTRSDSVTVAVEEGLPPTGTIAGTITVGAEATAAHKGLRASGDRLEMPHSVFGDAPFVPGEIIVGFAPGVSTQSATPLTVSGVPLGVIESIPALGVQLLGNRSLNAAETLKLVLELQRRSDVRYAQPNYIAQPAAVPNDPFYSYQWHYPAINLPAAWDITTGSPGVVVAVVDTGILHSFSVPSLTHPDLVGKVVPGYDFISDYRMARDGDGRDPDPYDVGDNPFGQSSYHGSHVAGTIAAATNNGTGVAGVDWNAAILPIRALGYGGGTIFDIVEGTLWASGHSIAGVPNNPNPAHVINLSLGWKRPCEAFEQEALDWIASSSSRRSIVIAAAGNDDIDAALMSPASCRNVITVGATDFSNGRAPYSNYGSRIDVMAPGGNTNVDWTGDGYPDGVLSLWKNDATGAFDYLFEQGTSMAAPHAAGVASLMKSLDPDITQAEVLAALQATARPLTASGCNRPSGAECGAGLIDAAAALALVRDNAIPAPGVGDLVFEPGVLDFGTYSGSLNVTMHNSGGSPLAWEATQFLESTLNPGDMLDYSVLISDFSGTIPAGGSQVVSLSVDRSLVTADGNYDFAVVFEVVGEASPAYLYGTFIKTNTAAPSLNGPMIVAAFAEDDTGELVLSGYAFSDSFFSEFAFEALAGANEVIAWSDENGNAEIDAGDYLGVFPNLVNVIGGDVTSGVEININEIISLSMSPAAAPHPAEQERWRGALEELARRRAP